jgi:hypothetical protein
MTAKMTHRKFNMAEACKRARTKLRVKHAKKTNNSFIRELWKDYIELSLTPTLLKYGKVQIDKNASLEIVGKRDIKLIRLKKDGKLSSTTTANKLRPGIRYKIVYEDKTHKGGKLIFTASKNLKKAVSEALMNTNTYYRIAS